jgi:hypothetical protein
VGGANGGGQLRRALLQPARSHRSRRLLEGPCDITGGEGEVDAQRRGHRGAVGDETPHDLEPALGLGVAAGEERAPPGQERARQVTACHLAEPIEQAAQGLDLPGTQQPGPVNAHQPCGAVQIAAGEPVADGPAVVAGGLEPGSGPPVKLGQVVGHRRQRLEAQEVAEQVVVSEPRPGAVEAYEELVRPGGLAQPLAVAAGVGDGVDQLAIELIEDRGLQQSAVLIGVEVSEQLVAEVLDDELVIAAEGDDERLGVIRSPEGEAGEDEAGGPALGPSAQLAEQFGVEGATGVSEQARGLVWGEAEVIGADLRDSAAHAEASETERRIHPGGEHDGDRRWAQVDEALHATVDALVLDEVVVVDHQHETFG